MKKKRSKKAAGQEKAHADKASPHCRLVRLNEAGD
jgi:hypothetical protein